MDAETPIRVGVSLDGLKVPRWKRNVLVALLDAPGVELALVVVTPPARTHDRGVAGALRRLYGAADRRVFAGEPDPLEIVDVEDLLEGVPTVDRLRSGVFQADAPDMALALGAEDDPLLSEAPLGMLAYRYGLHRARDYDVAYLRDVGEKRLASHVSLIRISDQVVLAESTIRTDLVSLERIRAVALSRCRSLVGRALRELRSGVRPTGRVAAPGDAPGSMRVAELLSTMARILARMVGRRFRNTIWREQWLLAVQHADGRSPPTSFAGARLHQPPPDRDWADPFPFRARGRSWLFYEELPWSTGRGHISVAELDDSGDLLDQRVALATPHHLSYPFVFVEGDEIYLLPESRMSAGTTLYRARAFPDEWEPVGMLFEPALYDPTPLRHDGSWWLFGTQAELGEPGDDELHLFHADELEGPWRAHPGNPVVSDVRGARPAGPLIRDGSRLLRPAQDCSGRYGRALVFKEVVELTRSVYREVEVARLEPDWLPRNLATHHYATDGWWTATDAQRRRRRW